ncbi:20395_t:CDS:2, partial [Racocetra persica]
MIQIPPNELHIQILKYVVTETNFEKFCALRTVCKKWNSFVPLVIYEAVIYKLSSGLKLKLTCDEKNKIVWSKKLSPTYCDSTKAFTFLFDQTEDTSIFNCYQESPKDFILTAYLEKSEDVLFPLELGAKFKGPASPQVINDDIFKYEFDCQNNLCFKWETKVEEGNVINHIRLYSFTIAAWKLCYILDCLVYN